MSLLPDPTITVSIASSVAAPMVGSMYSLTCIVTGTERLTNAMVTYKWLKKFNGAVVPGQKVAALSFSPLTFSDAGRYICQATVTSSLLSASIHSNSTNSISITPTILLCKINRSYTTVNWLHFISNSLSQLLTYPSVVYMLLITAMLTLMT